MGWGGNGESLSTVSTCQGVGQTFQGQIAAHVIAINPTKTRRLTMVRADARYDGSFDRDTIGPNIGTQRFGNDDRTILLLEALNDRCEKPWTGHAASI